MNGLLLIDKEVGMTSYDVIKLVKKKYHTRKVGHCGTLDPFASGLLIIGINQATKVMNFLEHDFKEYEFIIKLGVKTDTYDCTGEVVKTLKIQKITQEMILNVLNQFKGEIMQTPPIYSSIHINGKHLYEYARNHQEVLIPTRKVYIQDLQLIDFNDDEIHLKVKCSRGTYVRSLGVDIATSLNQVGHLSYLRRLSIGTNNVKNAYKINDLAENVALSSIESVLPFKQLFLNNEDLKKVYNGQDLLLQCSEEKVIIMDEKQAIAIYQNVLENKYHCVRGLYDEDIRFKRLKELSK